MSVYFTITGRFLICFVRTGCNLGLDKLPKHNSEYVNNWVKKNKKTKQKKQTYPSKHNRDITAIARLIKLN